MERRGYIVLGCVIILLIACLIVAAGGAIYFLAHDR